MFGVLKHLNLSIHQTQELIMKGIKGNQKINLYQKNLVLEKLKISIFEIPIISQTLSINN